MTKEQLNALAGYLARHGFEHAARVVQMVNPAALPYPEIGMDKQPAVTDEPRAMLIVQVHELRDQIERTLHLFGADQEGRKQAEGAIAYARKVSAPYNYNRSAPAAQQPWQSLPMASVPHPSDTTKRVVGFVVPNNGADMPSVQLAEILGAQQPSDTAIHNAVRTAIDRFITAFMRQSEYPEGKDVDEFIAAVVRSHMRPAAQEAEKPQHDARGDL